MGFTIESLADGTYYRGDVYKQDGFYLRVKITNNNEKAKQRTTVGPIAAFGELEATDPTFHGSAKGLLSFELNKPEGLSEGAQIEGNPYIEPGESIEWVYFWETKAEAIQGNYNGKGVLDEVDVKGVTWTRYTAETGTVYMYAKAPCGKTVHMFFDNGITWDDALPMMENVVLK